MDLDNASVLVAGGGGVGLDVTRKLQDHGSWVWQLQRTDVRRCAMGECRNTSAAPPRRGRLLRGACLALALQWLLPQAVAGPRKSQHIACKGAHSQHCRG